ncbi:MAG: chitobiase/beta-hexosaminidase C-terminal domain-containing protein, partial [Melioribacteraceae bacterium]|nr:chitobiase/beta-hexosaminidase C-terminal domain-containing protein [Melioribacteraceae bacterium]
IGEWNKLECIVNQGKISVYLNGILVNKAFDVKPRKGRIQIQSESAEIFFKKVELTLLPKNFRLMYDSDGGNMFIYKKPPMTPEMLYPYIDEVAETGVTSFFMSPHYGMPMIFPTKVAKMIGEDVSPELASKITLDAKPKTIERGVANLRSLIDAGYDPFGLVIDRAHQSNMEAFISFRLNEVHWVEKKDALILSHFWKEHPEWRIGENGDSLSQVYLDILGPRTSPVVAGWLPGGLNFAIPEVREHRIAQMREMCERFNIDGLDLDFQRFPMYFKLGEESKHIETMTNWIREIREMTRDVAAKRGRPILLCARIMAEPEQNLAIGLDPFTWANEGLLDFVVVSHYLHNNFTLPIKEYRELFPKEFPIYASIEVERDEENYRKVAKQLWHENVDGISLFNFFTSRESGIEPPLHVIHEIADSKILEHLTAPTIIRGDSLYLKPQKASITIESSSNSDIYYTLDGSEPTLNSIKYTLPLELKKITNIKVRAFKKDFPHTPSPVNEQKITFIDPKVNGLKYTVYEGIWEERPDLNNIKEVSTGKTFEFDVNKIKRRGDHVAIKFEGYVEIKMEGEYTLYSSANDGSVVYLDGKIVVDNAGYNGIKVTKGKTFLSNGKHKLELFYYENTGTESLDFEIEGPGMKKQPFPLESIFLEN